MHRVASCSAPRRGVIRMHPLTEAPPRRAIEARREAAPRRRGGRRRGADAATIVLIAITSVLGLGAVGIAVLGMSVVLLD